MKKILSAVFALILVFVLSCSAIASELPPLVADEAGTLTEQQAAELTEKLNDLSVEYDVDIVYASTQELYSYDAQDSADTYFDYNGYGVGQERDGIIFYICTETRDFIFSTSGSCIYSFTDDAIDYLGECALPHLKSGDYAGAVEAYADACDEILQMPDDYYIDSQGVHASSDYTGEDSGEKKLSEIVTPYIFALLISFVIALASTKKKDSMMKTAVRNDFAGNYIRQGSFNITHSDDIFLFSHTNKTPRPKETSTSSSGGSRSSTHTSSSGRTHGGGGGKF